MFEVICNKKRENKEYINNDIFKKYNILIMIIFVMITAIIIPFNSVIMYLCAELILIMHKNKTLNRQKKINIAAV
jgi:maltodextrin utilization protein YvdJ